MVATTLRQFALVLAIAALAVGPSWTQGPDMQTKVQVLPEDRERPAIDLHAYEALVTAYLAGDTSATHKILEWTPKRLAVVLGLVSGPGKGPAPWYSRRLAAAAFMHTDAALLRMAPKNATPAVEQHLHIAGDLLEKGTPTLDPIARRWYVAVGRVLRDHVLLAHEAGLLSLGRARLPDDPPILCESGTLEEYFATDRTVSDHRSFLLDHENERVSHFKARRAGSLSDGAGWLEQAVEHGSEDVLCRVHLGRVWSLRDDKRALPLLGGLQRHNDDAVAYLASMFLGGWAERRNDRDEAERQYRQAIARFPRGQIASVALSAVLLASGRVTEAREVLRPAIADPSSDRREPWWWYHFEPSAVVDARYEALKKEALR